MNSSLIELANALDELGLNKEADRIDALIMNASDCDSLRESYNELHKAFRDKMDEVVARGCIEPTINIHDFAPGENYKVDGCKRFIDQVEAAYAKQKAAHDKYVSKCGPTSSPAGGDRCRSQVKAYNEAFETLDALVVRQTEECYKQRKNQSYWTNDNQNKCRDIQIDICKAEHRAQLALFNAREACGCEREGTETCRGFRQGGRFRLPGGWSIQRHCKE